MCQALKIEHSELKRYAKELSSQTSDKLAKTAINELLIKAE